MADIFLSYTEKDRDTVRRLAQALLSVGWSVWWDRRIPAGQTWRGVLERELQSMRCMIVLWSTHSVQSEWVCEEAAEGRQLGRLVPVLIDRVRPPAGFRELQAADLVAWDGSAEAAGLLRLIEDIEHLIGKPPAPVMPAQAAAPAPVMPVQAAAPAPASGPSAGSAAAVQRSGDRRPWVWGAVGALILAAALGLYWRVEPPTPQAIAPGPSAQPLITRPPPAASVAATPPLLAASSAAAAPDNRETPAPGNWVTPAPALAKAGVARAPPGAGPEGRKPAGASSARCAALLVRLSLGEALSSESMQFLQQECRQ